MKKKSAKKARGQAPAAPGRSPAPGEKQKILSARARDLAREPEPAKEASAYLEVVEFLLAHESYALERAYINEIYPLKSITPLPCTPSFVLGIINLRGEIFSIVDLKVFFKLPPKGLSDLNRVVILHSNAMEFGILADRMLGVRSIPIEEIQPALPTLTGIRAEYLRGVTKEGLVILDAARIIADKRIIVHEEVEVKRLQ